MPLVFRLLLALVFASAFALFGLANINLRKQLDLARLENELLRAELQALRQQEEAERIFAERVAAGGVGSEGQTEPGPLVAP